MFRQNPKRISNRATSIATLFALVLIFGSGVIANAVEQDSANKAASCEDEAKTADLACNTPGTGGMDSGQAMMYTMMMNQLVQTGAQIAAIGKNMSAQCKLQSDVSKVMGSINGVKGAACVAKINSCAESCSEQATEYAGYATQFATSNPEASARYKRSANRSRDLAANCKKYSGQVVAMMTGAMQHLTNFAITKQCQSDLAAMAAAPVATLPPIAAVGGCEDPNNQTLACFCTRDANKSTAMCAGFGGGGGSVAGGSTAVPNGGSAAAPVGGTVAEGTDGNTTDPFGTAAKKNGDGPKGQGDGGSGAPGAGGISALSSEGGGGGPGADPRSAITGTSGGTSSGLGGSGGGGGGSSGLARNNGGAKESFFDKFNLKKFLPGSKYKTRGIAGMSVKSVDGITGPMGPSIWEKATRQYQEQIQKQNVIL